MSITQRLAAILLLVPFIAVSPIAAANEVVTVDIYVSVPTDTAPDATIYLAGNLTELGGWRADGVPLKRVNGDPVYHARLTLPRGEVLEFKVTRGDWETVEKGPGGEEIDNRTLKLDGDLTERITVKTWRTDVGDAEPRKSTVTGDVRVHDVASTILKNRRNVLVWLPPGYDDNPDASYPVLYMQDGQNLFDDATSFAGEWHVDETADRLIGEGKIEPVIIVGIENTPQRVLEYTPGSRTAPGKADQYARFVVEEVKPLVDATYRTKPDRAHTAVAGSSLGGLVSLYMVQKHGDLFGRCGAVSPSLWWDQGQYLKQLTADTAWARDTRVWIDMGTAENADAALANENVRDCRALADALRAAGFQPDRDFALRIYEGAKHNEQAWAERFDEILLFLYGSE